MFQAFQEFTLKMINGLRDLKRRYLVSQSYKRGLDILADNPRIPILLTDYNSLGGANIHLNAVKQDRYAAILDLENEAHRKKLEDMLSAGSKYRVFWSVV